MELSAFWFGLYKFVKFAVYPYTWVAALLGMATLLLFLPPSPHRLRWLRILVVAALLIVCLLGNFLVSELTLGLLEAHYPPFDQTTSQRFDAIVVLGGGVHSKGSLRPADQLSGLGALRTICGAELFAQGHAPKLLFTGGTVSLSGRGPREAVEMKKLAVKLGVPEAAILVEDQARNTYENAVGAKRVLDRGSILLVTSASHMPRAAALFRKQGFDVTPAPCTYGATDRPGFGWDGNLLRLLPNALALQGNTLAIAEAIGIILYWLTGKL